MSNDQELLRLYKLQSKINMMVLDGKRDAGKIADIYQGILDCSAEVSLPALHWYKKGDIIYLSVTSDGTTGPEWIVRLEERGFRLSEYAKSILISKDFMPTKGLTYPIGILTDVPFWGKGRTTNKVRAEAESRKLMKPNAEVACLIREKFSDKDIEDMGLTWIVVMHEPIKDSGNNPSLLGAGRDESTPWLGTSLEGLVSAGGERGDGFAFVVPRVAIRV